MKDNRAEDVTSSHNPTHQLLVVLLGKMQLGLTVGLLLETVPMVAVTPLPGAPPVVEGIIDYHGELAAVLDIRQRFGCPEARINARQFLVLARLTARLVAIRVDQILDLIDIDEAQIERNVNTHDHGDYIAGVARIDTGLLVIHDLARFLDLSEASRLDQALSEHS